MSYDDHTLIIVLVAGQLLASHKYEIKVITRQITIAILIAYMTAINGI